MYCCWSNHPQIEHLYTQSCGHLMASESGIQDWFRWVVLIFSPHFCFLCYLWEGAKTRGFEKRGGRLLWSGRASRHCREWSRIAGCEAPLTVHGQKCGVWLTKQVCVLSSGNIELLSNRGFQIPRLSRKGLDRWEPILSLSHASYSSFLWLVGHL